MSRLKLEWSKWFGRGADGLSYLDHLKWILPVLTAIGAGIGELLDGTKPTRAFIWALAALLIVRLLALSAGKASSFKGWLSRIVSGQQSESPPTSPNPPTENNSPANPALSPAEEIASLKQALDQQRAMSYRWEYSYLTVSLPPPSQMVLDWLYGQRNTPPTITWFNKNTEMYDTGQRDAILRPLHNHFLFQYTPAGLMRITPKGCEYVEFRGPYQIPNMERNPDDKPAPKISPETAPPESSS